MKRIKLLLIPLSAVLVIGMLVVGGLTYISQVRSALWTLSVADLRQVTIQAGHSVTVYVQKDLQSIHGMALNMARVNSSNLDYIKTRLDGYNDNSNASLYSVMNVNKGILYSSEIKDFAFQLPEDRKIKYESFSGRGVEEPYISMVHGLRSIACYECFTFADGVKGIVRRSVPIADISQEFGLSLYNGSAFSYIINGAGDILIRSNHADSSHTYNNIFDAIEIEFDETTSEVTALKQFRDALSAGEDGVARFTVQDGTEYIYAFVPIAGTSGWYYLTVVPSDILMEQSNRILRISWLLILIAILGIFVLIVIILLMRKTRLAVQRVNREVQYREQLFDVLTDAGGGEDAYVMFAAKDKTVEYVSPNTESLLGLSAKAIKKNFSALGSGSPYKLNFVENLAKLQNGDSFSIEEERIHQISGERRWFRYTVYCVGAGDETMNVMVLSDRTAENTKEKALTEAVNLAEAANHAKSSFLSNMSHDIRTPMNAIIGLCTLLARDASDPNRVLDYTKKITASGQHLLGLINDVLDMSKIEAGKTVLNISEIDLAEIVDGLSTIFMPQAKAKEQTFLITVENITTEYLLGDELRINQILINLLSNAIKYTPVGGKIELMIRQLPQVSRDFMHLRFIVKDNGMGMEPAYVETIFQPFSREVNSNINKIQGTGLGMTITKGLIDLMGGNISVESEPGAGSTFTVDLELRIRTRDIDPEFWQKNGVTQILVVDDDEIECQNVVRTMEDTGVKMDTALSGPIAIEKVAAHTDRNYDLILLDWKMPGMDGIETARHIRALVPENVPILILTAYDWSDIEKDAKAAGIDAFLPKPFFRTNFELTVERLRKESTPYQPEDDGELHGLHILAAEDNELNSEILSELLSMLGASCDIEPNGQRAVDRFLHSKPGEYDLILMDIQMPIMNGYDATRAIRAGSHPMAADIPIIAMTADAFAEDIRKALDAGMNAHVAKPIDLDNLKSAVREVRKERAQ